MIIIPEGLTDAAALENVFLHEIIHARRFDNWYRLLLVLAQSVHWFNPAVAFFFRKIERGAGISVRPGGDGAERSGGPEGILRKYSGGYGDDWGK